MESCQIASERLQAMVVARGAELCSLRRAKGPELLWNADPNQWGRHAPHLFPVVGCVREGQILHRDQRHPMPRHGFARDARFDIVRLTRESCTLVLRDDATTRRSYPFPFELRITYTIGDRALRVAYELINRGEGPLPASLGAHPGFLWPLVPGAAREDHRIEFEKPEPAPVRRLNAGGLLRGDSLPTPIQNRELALNDALFQDDVLILDQVQSRSVRYLAPGGPVLRVSWEGFPHLAIWSKPGAGFLCIEPWAGLPDPEGFAGEFEAKPGVFQVPAGSSRALSYSVALLD